METFFSQIYLTFISQQPENIQKQIAINLTQSDNLDNHLKDLEEISKLWNLENIEISISRKLYKMEQNSRQNEEFYSKVTNNIKKIIKQYICTNTKSLTGFTYKNLDLIFNPIDEVLELFQYTKQIKNCSIESTQLFTIPQYELLLQRLGELPKLETLFTKFEIKNGQLQEYNKNQLNCFESINILKCKSILQTCILKSCGSLKKIDIQFENISNSELDNFFSQTVEFNPLIINLNLSVTNKLQNNKMCFQHLEKLSKLEILSITLNENTLSKQDLNLNKLNSLQTLTLKCKEPLNYFTQFEKISIQNMILINNGILKKQLSQTKVDFEVEKFSYTFSCQKEQQISYIISEINTIATSVCKFNNIKLNFSSCLYFQLNNFDKEIIRHLGDLFKKCSSFTIIDLQTKGCLFNNQLRFYLGYELQKISNIQQFTINEFNIYKYLEAFYYKYQITFIKEDYLKVPYFLGVLYNDSLLRRKIIALECEQLLETDLGSINQNKYNKYIFQRFLRLSLNFKSHQIIVYNNLLPFLKSFASEYLVYLHLDFIQINLKSIYEIIDSFQYLNEISANANDLENFFPKDDFFNTVPKRNIQINLKVRLGYYHTPTNLQQFLKIKGHFLNLQFKNMFNFYDEKQIIDTFKEFQEADNIHFQVLRQKQDIVLSLLCQRQISIYQEKVKLNIFQSLIEPFLPINPTMVYLDLFIP